MNDSKMDFNFPTSYVEFVNSASDLEMEFERSYLVLWPFKDLEGWNNKYLVNEFAPGLFIIGSNGGGEAFALDKQTGAVYSMPFIGMSREEAIFCASDFGAFINWLKGV